MVTGQRAPASVTGQPFEVAGRLAPPPPNLVTADDVRAACLTLLRVGGPRDVAVRAVLDEFVDRLARRDVLLPHSPTV